MRFESAAIAGANERIRFELNDASATLNSGWRTGGAIDRESALTFAKICDASYLDVGAFKEACAEHKVQVLWFDIVDATVFAAVRVQQQLVIVFRGSDDWSDWSNNVNFLSVEVKGFRIHSGFAATYDSIKRRVLSLVKSHRGEGDVWLTGHSRGGALALLAAWNLGTEIGASRIRLVTFGQPRVAEEELAKHLRTLLKDRYARFVNGSDVVPHIPPHFSRTGDEIHLSNGVAKVTPATEASAMSQMTIAKLEETLFSKRNNFTSAHASAVELAQAEGVFADHSIREYIRVLKSI